MADVEDTFDPYAELQLSPDAEPELVRAAFKALAKKYHPDRYSDPIEKSRAEQKMIRINEAQALLQSGKYRPPLPESSKEPPRHSEPRPTAAVKTKPQTAKAKSSRSIRRGPFVFFAILLLSILLLPSLFSDSHLERALALEKQDRLQDSLVYLNKAIASSPHQRELYNHRARVWQKLGEPEKAAIDLKNAREPTLTLPNEPKEKEEESDPYQVPEPSGENSATHVP